MGHGRNPVELNPPAATTHSASPKHRRFWFISLGILAAALLLTTGLSLTFLLVRTRTPIQPNPKLARVPTLAISKTCELTLYPSLCINSLVDFPGALEADETDLVHISVNMTLTRFGSALYNAAAIANNAMATLARAAYEDCIELLDGSLDHLSNSLLVVAPASLLPPESRPRDETAATNDDVITWLSAALTNQDTCDLGLRELKNSPVKEYVKHHMKDLTELASNSLAIVAATRNDNAFSTIPIQNKKRRLLGFPEWVSNKDRKLLQIPASEIQPDYVVSKRGENGCYSTINAALKAAPEHSKRRIVIYIKAGRYEENVKVSRKMSNFMFIGDGEDLTVIAGSRSVSDHLTTFHTATFAATGPGLIMRDMTIENSAGPEKHQAVALRVGGDHAVIFRCKILGYQDTLYVHSLRQFYRECKIFGTVDFIFGNAAVVLQNCTIWARKPLPQQKNTITAQGRKDPNQNTGISIHDCQVLPTPELEAARANSRTYLGRPWKLYSRVVFMMSNIGDHIDPAGWLEWNGDYALDTLYYGEYMNYGPGAGVGKRVRWPGYRVITLPAEANKFTVDEFIFGSSWLPSTGVSFLAGLEPQ